MINVLNSLRVLLIFVLLSVQVFAQSATPTAAKNKSPYPAKYTSAEDTSLTLKSITVAPGYDNVGGIYKKAAEEQLKTMISNDTLWAYSDFKAPQKEIRVDQFEENPEITMAALKSSDADGLMTVLITKGAQGLTVTLNFFTKDRGLLLLQETYQDPKTFELVKLNEVLTTLYSTIKQKLPFKGMIASRRGNQVTINLGSKSGLKTGDKISVGQILKINRHPKLKFMTGVEKEIIGQVTITKVEDYLSFGEIAFEKETGVLEKGSKIMPFTNVEYAISGPKGVTLANEKNPVEWLPTPVPQFGKVSVLGGFTTYTLSSVLTTGEGYDSGNSVSPTVDLDAEFWVTQNVFASIGLSQIFFKGTNGLTGSSPTTLDYNVGSYDFLLGYKYLISDNFWGPNLTASLGYGAISTRVTDSTPVAFTSTELSGLIMAVGGYFPISEKNDIGMGVDARFMFAKTMTESPVDSGSADPSYSQFGIYGIYQYTTNIHLKGQLNYMSINTSFSGTPTRANPARSFDQTATMYLFGIEYLF